MSIQVRHTGKKDVPMYFDRWWQDSSSSVKNIRRWSWVGWYLKPMRGLVTLTSELSNLHTTQCVVVEQRFKA